MENRPQTQDGERQSWWLSLPHPSSGERFTLSGGFGEDWLPCSTSDACVCPTSSCFTPLSFWAPLLTKNMYCSSFWRTQSLVSVQLSLCWVFIFLFSDLGGRKLCFFFNFFKLLLMFLPPPSFLAIDILDIFMSSALCPSHPIPDQGGTRKAAGIVFCSFGCFGSYFC